MFKKFGKYMHNAKKKIYLVWWSAYYEKKIQKLSKGLENFFYYQQNLWTYLYRLVIFGSLMRTQPITLIVAYQTVG